MDLKSAIRLNGHMRTQIELKSLNEILEEQREREREKNCMHMWGVWRTTELRSYQLNTNREDEEEY
jgi:hypothetical protein